MSSICGKVCGVPTSSVYAASKAYQKSFCLSIGCELESQGIAVTCVMPGAVIETNFAARSCMNDSAVFSVPFLTITPQMVAEATVKGMLRGEQEIIVGFVYKILGRIGCYLLPPRLVLLCNEIAFRPISLVLPFIYSKKGEDKDKSTATG